MQKQPVLNKVKIFHNALLTNLVKRIMAVTKLLPVLWEAWMFGWICSFLLLIYTKQTVPYQENSCYLWISKKAPFNFWLRYNWKSDFFIELARKCRVTVKERENIFNRMFFHFRFQGPINFVYITLLLRF